jgi:hypothetical protein
MALRHLQNLTANSTAAPLTKNLTAFNDSTGNSSVTGACVPPEAAATEVPAWTYAVIVGLATMSGMFSGLNLGLLGLDVSNLELLVKSQKDSSDE